MSQANEGIPTGLPISEDSASTTLKSERNERFDSIIIDFFSSIFFMKRMIHFKIRVFQIFADAVDLELALVNNLSHSQGWSNRYEG
jgi:hypothetical protein